jgi:amidase
VVDASAGQKTWKPPRWIIAIVSNPATGPVAIEGADPGDVLTVDILGIDLNDSGYTLVKPGFGVIADMVERPIAGLCPIVDGVLHFGDPRLPIRPMIGVIATAPAGEPLGTTFVGPHGGNLDCNRVTVGSKVHLPARTWRRCFLLAMCIATMGDGEISGSGFEVAARVNVRLSLSKGSYPLEWPWLETKHRIVTLGSA